MFLRLSSVCCVVLPALCACPVAQAVQAQAQPGPAQQDTNAAEPPIIDDEEFDATIPPIDPDAPLGTVEDWDAEQAQLEAQAQAAGEPSSAAEPMLPRLPDEPEINAPLGPIESFDVEPFDESRYTEADDSVARSVRYSYRIEGLDSLQEAAENTEPRPDGARSIRARFEELSALDDGDGKASNGAMVSARMLEDQQLLADLLIGECFYDATVNGAIEFPENGTGPLVVVLTASPGPCYRFGSITFNAPPVEPADLISRNFVPTLGQPIDAERVLAAEANIAVALPQAGYPFAQVGQRDVLLDPETESGDYTLPVTPGPRSSFGDILTRGSTVFDADHISKLARFDKGDLYDSRLVDDLRKALVATGLYSTVAVQPQQTGVEAPGGTQYADLAVDQEAGPARTLAANAGYGTGQGKSQFFICIPRNGQPATNGNGTQVTFLAKDKAAVDKFHAAALAGGGSDEGAPGYRPPDKTTSYGAYVRDPYGNKLMASCANPG